MEDKKKHLFIKMAFLLLFVLLNLLGFCSTCLAITPISEFSTEDYRAVLEKFYDNWYYNTNPNYKNYLRNILDNPITFQDTFTALKNNLINSDIQYIEQIMITSSGYSIWFSPNNNTIGNSLPLVYVSQSSYDASYNNIHISFLDAGNYAVFPKIARLFLEVPSSDITTSSTYLEFKFSKNYPITVDDLSDTCFIPGVYSIHRAGSYNLSVQNITPGWYWGNDNTIINKTVIPPSPSGDISGDNSGETGIITNPSGEVIGNIDLSGIEQGIGQVNENLENIENKIPSSGDITNIVSGEIGKVTETITSQPDISNTVITSGDIESALNFEFESDPYANFWLELTNGLREALLDVNRTIDVTFQNRTWTIDLDQFAVLPAWLKIIITPFSTVFFVWVLVRWWKLILDKITSGNVDSVLNENSEERYF